MITNIVIVRTSEERIGLKAREPEVRRVSTVEKIKTEVEPVVKVKTEGKSATVNKAPESKSVFSRLGATDQASSSSRLGGKNLHYQTLSNILRLKVETDDIKQEVKGVFGRLGKQEEVVVKVKEQEPRVTSTSEEKTQDDLRSARASASPGRGIHLNCSLFPF